MQPAKTPLKPGLGLHPYFLIGRPGENPCRELRGISASRFRGETIVIPALPRPSFAVASVQQREFFVRREFYGDFEALWIEVPAEHPLWDRADPLSGAFWDYGKTDFAPCGRGERAQPMIEDPLLAQRPRHDRCGLFSCQDEHECTFPAECVVVRRDQERLRRISDALCVKRTPEEQAKVREALYTSGASSVEELLRVAGGEREDMKERIEAAKLLLAGQTPAREARANLDAANAGPAPIDPDTMLDPMDPTEYAWRAEGRDNGWTAPDRRPWWRRLPVIRHAAALWLSWQVHSYAGGWAEVGIGIGGPCPQDLWVVEGAFHGYW